MPISCEVCLAILYRPEKKTRRSGFSSMHREQLSRHFGLVALFGASVNIVEALDIVLTQIAAGLDFDDFQRNLAGLARRCTEVIGI